MASQLVKQQHVAMKVHDLLIHSKCPNGRRHRERTRTRWKDYVSNALGTQKRDKIAGEKEVWASLLTCVTPLQINGRGWIYEYERITSLMYIFQ